MNPPSLFSIRSRSQQLAGIQSELFTLFPNGTGPIPIHTMDTKTENMSPNYDACPKLTSDLYALQNTTGVFRLGIRLMFFWFLCRGRATGVV